jgi:hypothetical protein
MINMLHRNEKFVTFYNKFSNIQRSNSMHLENRVQRSRVVRQTLSSHSLVWVAAFKMRASKSSCVPTFLF